MRNLLLASLLALTACTPSEPLPPTHAIDLSWRYEEAAPDFALADSAGQPRKLSDFRGKVVALYFGYTHCPDICPTTLATLARVTRKLGAEANQFQVLFVTVDPERDTSQLLAQFVPFFHPDFIGLRGDAQATERAASALAVSYEKHEEGGSYVMDHTDGVFLIGKDGKTVLLARSDESEERLTDDIKLLLARR
ncbi:MAG: SCO family protein [Gallionellaceae bacterium]|jgi:protein SCO1/2|nr:SCO family protein [Gallionellaceae bacterium]